VKKNITVILSAIVVYLIFLILIGFIGLIDGITLKSSIIPVFISTGNFLVAVYLFRLSHKKDNVSFLIYNFGGLVIRLGVILVLIFYCLKFLNIETYAFIFHLLIFYFLLQIMEIKIITENKQR
jgi:hypothetical protein